MVSFDYNYQNPLVFCFLMLIGDIVLWSLLGFTKFEFEKENDMNSGQITSSFKKGLSIRLRDFAG